MFKKEMASGLLKQALQFRERGFSAVKVRQGSCGLRHTEAPAFAGTFVFAEQQQRVAHTWLWLADALPGLEQAPCLGFGWRSGGQSGPAGPYSTWDSRTRSASTRDTTSEVSTAFRLHLAVPRWHRGVKWPLPEILTAAASCLEAW